MLNWWITSKIRQGVASPIQCCDCRPIARILLCGCREPGTNLREHRTFAPANLISLTVGVVILLLRGNNPINPSDNEPGHFYLDIDRKLDYLITCGLLFEGKRDCFVAYYDTDSRLANAVPAETINFVTCSRIMNCVVLQTFCTGTTLRNGSKCHWQNSWNVPSFLTLLHHLLIVYRVMLMFAIECDYQVQGS
jgi:hypothetical protein